MKVSKAWLKELVDLKVSLDELVRLLPLRTIGLKEVTPDYIELDMKGYNRADLLSIRGVAREVAAITDSEIKFYDEEINFPDLPKVKVTADPFPPVYCVAKIENLKVEQSNETWIQKLNNSGMRSVNNITDITNLIMLEYGQPLHAFDASEVEGESIIVRKSRDGEKLTTLDGKERILENDLLITDPNKILGLAGVMGGKYSEVSDNTSTVMLEAAIFDPVQIRKTATRLGLQSEASKRFYHGLTKKRLLHALDAAIRMYQEIGGKLTALTIVDNLDDKKITIDLNQNKVNSLIGIDIPEDKVKELLGRLHFEIDSDWKVTVPYWRLDINIEEDLIEEVARMYGYEKIPSKPLHNTNIPNIDESPIFGLIQDLKQALVDLGLIEVQTYSYYSTKTINDLRLTVNDLIKIANPISAETEYLRNNIWPNLLEVVAKNIKNGYKDIAIFEIGKIYFKNKAGEISEKYVLSLALMNNTENPLAEIYEIFKKLNFDIGETEKEKGANTEVFHPNRFIQLHRNGKIVGSAAEVHKRVTDKFGISQRIAVLEINLDNYGKTKHL